MVMEELMLVNPEDAGQKRHRRKAKALEIIFPKPVRRKACRRRIRRRCCHNSHPESRRLDGLYFPFFL